MMSPVSARPLLSRLVRRKPVLFLIVCLVLGLGYRWLQEAPAPPRKNEGVPVQVGFARTKDLPRHITSLGTAIASNTVLVKSRVDGQLVRLHFTEGQPVKQGDLLAEVDPRPFQAQLRQARGAYARDEALLKDATLTLRRYKTLRKDGSISVQELQAQEALVGQYTGILQIDAAAVADAALQLEYSQITAPISGTAGIKKVDEGNQIRASDPDGIVVLTQTDPMHVLFTLIERQIPDVRSAMQSQGRLQVDAYDQHGNRLLATGSLLTLDNQIDTATGTVKAKAVFTNARQTLYPNQFVNISLLVEVLRDALVVPTAAVQRDGESQFVYGITLEDQALESKHKQNKEKPKEDNRRFGRVSVRKVTTGYASDTETHVLSGVHKGDIVVIDGLDKLRDGTAVFFTPVKADTIVSKPGAVPQDAASSSGVPPAVK